MKYLFSIFVLTHCIFFNLIAMEKKSTNATPELKETFANNWLQAIQKLHSLEGLSVDEAITSYQTLLDESAAAGIILGDKAHIRIHKTISTLFTTKILQGRPAIYAAIDLQKVPLIKSLLQHQINLDAKKENQENQTPLDYAQKKLLQSIEEKNLQSMENYATIVSLLQKHILAQQEKQPNLIVL